MAIESVTANPGADGADFAVDTITDSVQVPYVKLMSGTDAAEDLIGGDATNGLDVDVTRVSGTVAVSNAGLTELAAAINASSQMDVNIAASNATVAISHAALTELAAAIDTEVQVDVVGALPAGDNNIGNVDVVSSTLPTGAATSANQTTIIGHLDGVEGLLTTIDADTGNIVTAVQLLDNSIVVDDAAFTPATTSVNMAGFQADETSTDSVDEGDAGAARMTLDRKVIVTPQPHTSGGCTPFYNLDVDESEDAIKASAGQLYELYLFNTTNAILYVKLYNATTANVTVGTTTPVMTIPVPGNNDTDGAGVVRNWPLGIAFDTAITIAATTGAADNDTGAPGANALIASGAYK